MIELVIVGVFLLFPFVVAWIVGIFLLIPIGVMGGYITTLKEVIGGVLDITFGDRAKAKHFPRLVGLGTTLLVGGTQFLWFWVNLSFWASLDLPGVLQWVLLPPFGGRPEDWLAYCWFMLRFSLVGLIPSSGLGAVVGFLVWTAAKDYQREKYAKQKKE